MHKNNPGKVWKLFASWNVHRKSPNYIDESLLTDLEALNSHVNTVGGNSPVDDNFFQFYQDNLRPGLSDLFNFTEISIDDLREALSGLRSNATGIDGINLKMNRLVAPFCAEHLVDIFNHSFSSGVFPKLWKVS